MTTGGHPPPISAEVLFNVRRRGLKRGDDYEDIENHMAFL